MTSGAPRTIGRYEVRRELGRGTMGVVYEAYDPSLDRTVALKTVSATPTGSAEERQLFEQRFFAEAQIAARLSHAGIVIIHDVGRDAATGLLFIALEHLRGTTLAERVADGRALEWREALRIAAAVADALHYAHAKKVVHLDVKPANIMLLPNGQPKLMDFGIARIETARLKLAPGAESLGMPLFLSPEQALGQPLDGRADVFALGSVLYTMVTGRLAFEAENVAAILKRVIGEDPEPPSRLVPGLPEGVDGVVTRALAKSPSERYQTAGLFAEDARDLLAGRPARHAHDWRAVPASQPPLPPPPSPAGTEDDEVDALLEPLLEPLEPVDAVPAPAAAAFSGASGGGPGEPTWVSAVAMPPTEVREDREKQRRAARRRRMLRRGAIAAAALVLAVLLLRARTTPPEPPDIATPAASGAPMPPRAAAGRSPVAPSSTPAAPARLLVDFEHPLRAGQLRLWVDDQLVVDESLAGRVSRKLIVKVRKGGLQEELDIAPGRHDVRVQVTWDDNQRTERIFGTFKPGETRRLEVRLGRLRKNLSVDWK